MARYLAYTSPARGHLYPIVPILTELRERGHEVSVRTRASEVAPVRDTGITTAAIDPAIEAIEVDDWRARTPMGALKRAMRMFAARAPLDFVDCRDAIADEEPDAVLVDIMAWGANVAAEAAGIRWASFCPFLLPIPSPDTPPFGPGLAPRSDRLGRVRDALISRVGPAVPPIEPINRLRASVGLPHLNAAGHYWTAAERLIYLTAEPFEYSRSDWPASVRMVGPCVWEPPEDPPAWLDEDTRPLVLVTTSTDFQDDGKLIAVALEALADEDVRVVATTAGVDPSLFSPPANARVERFLPHGALIERASCVVCHGGMGITQKALAAAVPVCVVPFGRDQLETARRVEVARAGSRLPAGRLNVARLRKKVREAIECKAGAERVAAGFARARGAPAAADVMEELLHMPRTAAGRSVPQLASKS
jgi:MGT family glycosyltransferase